MQNGGLDEYLSEYLNEDSEGDSNDCGKRVINRNYDRTEHDDYILNIQPLLGANDESIAIIFNGMIIGWKIQKQYT